jgi:hypothetical protein
MAFAASRARYDTCVSGSSIEASTTFSDLEPPIVSSDKESNRSIRPTRNFGAWSADARSLWIFRRGEIPAHVYKLDRATGKREIWNTLVPPDAAGVYSVIEFQITPKGDAYVYSYTRILSQLYLVRGLK